jgi:hypothetical protein
MAGTNGSWRLSGISTSAMARRPRQIGSIIGWPGIAVESGHGDGRIGAEVARQIERELHARRAFGEALVDAHLEIKARSRCRSTMPDATGMSPAFRVTISQLPRAAASNTARRTKAASPSC